MKKLLSVLLAAPLFAVVLAAAPAVGAHALSFEEYGTELPIVENVEGVSRYSKNTQPEFLTAEEAAAANVTVEGAYVARIPLTQANCGVTLDFSAQEIPIYAVESVDLRVRVPRGTEEIRISVDQSTRWVMRYKVELTRVGRFMTISLGADGTNFWAADAYTMQDLANEKGDLGAFELMFFSTAPAPEAYAYLDSATVTCRPLDVEAPVIDYDGETELTTSAERPLSTLVTATAYDEYEERAVEVEYLPSEGAVDANGMLLEGEHTLTLRATDGSGNRRELVIVLHVGGKDTVAPEIVFPNGEIETVRTVVGAYPDIRTEGRDNIDRVTVEQVWSEGALDEWGRLTAGEHTCTLICVDGTGNRTERTVRYLVGEAEPLPVPEEKDGCRAVSCGLGMLLCTLGAALVCCGKRRG